MSAPTSVRLGRAASANTPRPTGTRQQFAVFALNMSWQLAGVVLVPVLGGVALDKKLGTSPACMLAGLAVALIGSGAVLLRTMQIANRLPVPKLTAAQKRAVQKSYEEDDD